MADVPKDLLQEIKQLEEMLTVDTKKLKQITEHFQSELAKGLSVEGGSIVCHGNRPKLSQNKAADRLRSP